MKQKRTRPVHWTVWLGILLVLTAVMAGPLMYRRILHHTISQTIRKQYSATQPLAGYVYSLPVQTVRLKSSRPVLLTVKVSLETTHHEAEQQSELVSLAPGIQQIISNILSVYTPVQARQPDRKMDSKNQIKDKLNQLLLQGQVRSVYFEEYLIMDTGVPAR